jgi:hypothetical protein
MEQSKDVGKETWNCGHKKKRYKEIMERDRKGNNSMLKSIKNKVLRVFHQNIRGLRNKTNEISSSHGGEYEVQSCLLGCTAV